MPIDLLLNIVLVISVLGILVLFLRRLPEVVQEKGQLRLVELMQSQPEPQTAGWQKVLGFFKYGTVAAVKKVWHFMLEAKDLKQGQVLAAKFAQSIPMKKNFNIGVLSTLRKGQRLHEEAKLDEAEEVYLSIIKKDPHEYGAYEGLVKIYTERKSFGEVQQVLEYLVRHNPENDRYLVQLGAVLMKRRRFKEAIGAYEQAVKINGLVSVRFINVGLCYEAMNDLAKARQSFQQAVDLEPSNMQYLMMLVDLVLKMGDADRARMLLEKGAQIDPDSAMVKEKLLSLNI